MIMRSARLVAAALTAVAAIAGCSFSFGGPDYQKLSSQITDELNKSYSSLGHKVTSVDCPKQDPTPKTGDKFNCTADVEGAKVRVEVEVTSDNYDVKYSTLDKLFDLPITAQKVGEQLTEQYGFDVTVDCGEGLKAVEGGTTFECTASDPNGEEKQVEITAGKGEADDSIQLLD